MRLEEIILGQYARGELERGRTMEQVVHWLEFSQNRTLNASPVLIHRAVEASVVGKSPEDFDLVRACSTKIVGSWLLSDQISRSRIGQIAREAGLTYVQAETEMRALLHSFVESRFTDTGRVSVEVRKLK
jgi:hypothetical protein